MKSRCKNFLFMPLLFCGSILLLSEDANAVACAAGQYPYLSWCHGCIAGCYCTGPGIYQGAGYLNTCNNDDKIVKFGAITHSSGWNNVYTCPKDYKYSDSGAKSASDCYAKCNGTNIYYKDITCGEGKYRPKGSNDCKPCPDDGKSACAGMKFKPTCNGASADEGIKKCDTDTVPNAAKSACVKPEGAVCIEGTYLPANSEECAACPAGYQCPGITATQKIKKQPIDQGKELCPKGTVSPGQLAKCQECEPGTAPNEDASKCVNSNNIKVDPGYYLPANSAEQRKCTSKKKYCPGGWFGRSNSDGGIYDCPLNSSVNASFTACIIELTKDQLKYGAYGKIGKTATQCWIKTDPEDYKACIYGTRQESTEE